MADLRPDGVLELIPEGIRLDRLDAGWAPFIAVLGIILRGAAYALRAGASSARESGVSDTIFSVSSVLTPVALGAAIGAIATDRVPVGNASCHLFSSWLNPSSIFIGALAVANCACLAAVYLAAADALLGDRPLEQAFRGRALGAGVIAGAIALAGVGVITATITGCITRCSPATRLPR